ncbi:MAG TPA: prepilin-type N-terminal cleavage/methylation domain-containing protein [Candidatus Paceibacterota bacterium]|nr:prepilin-type N-terminal cleavage/methylation domain-containing protein [Candidatus Paceibacterota bacterium]
MKFKACTKELKSQRANELGLTLIEIMIAIALLVIIATIGLVAANPAGQIAGARNNERQLHLQALMNSIRQNIADTSGETFTCVAGAIPTTSTDMASASGSYNIAPCIIPAYLFTMPFDPSASGAHYTSVSDYDTDYTIMENASGVITVAAPYAELKKSISISR